MNRKSEQNNAFERRIERIEESTSVGINQHTSILCNDMYPLRRRRRTISLDESIQILLDTDPRSTIVNGSMSFRSSRSSLSSVATDSQGENSNDRRSQFTSLLRREQEEETSPSTTIRSRRRNEDGARGHRLAPSILERPENNATGNDSDNPSGLNDEWSNIE